MMKIIKKKSYCIKKLDFTKMQLNEFAQNWSDELGQRGRMSGSLHRPDNPHGENLFYASAGDAEWVLTAKDVVKAWLVVQ